MTKTKTKGTNAKIKELKGIKPEKVTEEQLGKIQKLVDTINRAQMDIGALESRKHQALHFLAGTNDELQLMQDELMKEYGTNDVNIQDGVINYGKDVEADS
jgi:FtsZ-binding cell division protein ZapB